jgi:hypothetical protein
MATPTRTVRARRREGARADGALRAFYLKETARVGGRRASMTYAPGRPLRRGVTAARESGTVNKGAKVTGRYLMWRQGGAERGRSGASATGASLARIPGQMTKGGVSTTRWRIAACGAACATLTARLKPG